ncbi:D-amino acid dehydrogenase [Wohlfahrtiimonas chitiniclastica]|uniref:D-amino acid dehydrogenase n=1 Tax=Wohlfahrtiimonas chitiniclastica TaxID=400946 RepID=UPI0007B4073C|nr:D-amino acid dehydrogenase [Wohlfahrtiimonas chitiniclastica]KZS24082.1 D-amino acid dehydrogenase small subunit [Wohlfahrtiimonas chitiniclastica]MBS7817233.1 D-amino acid dehydrogenase [Wohlfahrtiimonas chitiniclastica]MBS7822912.1 D-amino acid dehydrogenase [Wohlfahrtiimonas chitiniclastica]MBS7830726.1 D-amino acid dehydrogenase [Wohlfahrtiimonas chitiniclastica]MBS7832694.1 D-amino acid dehydrogenase [Wohlfahrtiimonas chitiniclastica]
MNIIILGAGVIGVTQAYYLAKKGYKVTVFERHEGPALDTSHANAGQISPGYATPWAAPGIPFKAIKWMLEKHAPLAIRPTADLNQYKFMWDMFLNCNKEKYAINKSRLVRLSEYSRDCLIKLREDTGIYYENRSLGTTQLLRTKKQMEGIKADLEVLEKFNVPFEVLDAQGILNVEPGLKHSVNKLEGGLRLPNDETGDCFLFTNRLADIAKTIGVEFKFNQTVEDIIIENKKVKGIRANGEEYDADIVVDCLGTYTPFLLKKIGIKAPIYPLKGYSLTADIIDENAAPTSTILDETYKIAITRFDKRIRIGGMAEISGYQINLNPKRRATLEFVTEDLFPGAGNLKTAIFWSGLRPKTPDSTPIIGGTEFENFYINAGHGTLGWTQSCGSASYLSDIIAGNQPEISTEGLDISRYAK